MKILIVGNGGREHAICWKVAQSKLVTKIWVASGNAGTIHEPKTTNVNLSPGEIEQLVKFAKDEMVDLTIVGPEGPLAAGICDRFCEENLPCFGPSKAAAALESSKIFCKHFLQKNAIPTAQFACFEDVYAALTFLKTQSMPIVIKADGLAAGKGVVIAATMEEAEASVRDMLEANKFGHAGSRIVIEEFLQGEELSFIAMVDGKNILPLASTQDHKRRDDGDKGPNTGGMGAYSPSPLLTPHLESLIMHNILQPTVEALRKSGKPYRGFLYAGLMIDKQGQPKVLEFNCRLGDPETQPIMMRLTSDLVTLCLAALEERLDTVSAEWDPQPALSIVIASAGYPGATSSGSPIDGLNQAVAKNVKIFHAGTTEINNTTVTAGGRVLTVTAKEHTLEKARDEAYKVASGIRWPGSFYRSDIGHSALKSQSNNAK